MGDLMDASETDFSELREIIDELNQLDNNPDYFLKKNDHTLNRRQNGQRPWGEAVKEHGSLDFMLLRNKTERLAEYCFSGCHLQMRNYHFIREGENPVLLETAVKEKPLECRVDFSLPEEGHHPGISGVSLFVEEFSRYLGLDLGFDQGDLVKMACQKIPDFLSREQGYSFASFEFNKSRYSFSLRKIPFTFDLSCREYLNKDFFKFNLAKSSPDASWFVFERYPSIDKIRIEGTIPYQVAGPDGVVDDIGQNLSLLENYLDFVDNGVLA
ncbi:MAG: hypothetical protein ABIA37_05145 [Candidatus Woesearchaeota archaeon]